jgi:hypothetical protein
MSANSNTESTQSNTELNDITYYNERAYFHFKLAYTEQTTKILVPVNICIANFIEYVKFEVYNRFNIDRNLNIEIVEAGQGTRELRGEDAPALQLDFDTTVRQKFNGSYETAAFYIRIIQ